MIVMSIAPCVRHRGPVGGNGLPVCHQICRVKPIRDENGLAVDFEIDGDIRSMATTTSA